jgi:hypothetical protein
MNIQQVDGLKWVQSSEKQLFATGRANPVGLLAYIVADVLELGRGACHIEHRDSWWLVGSDVDWMTHASIPVQQLFERVVVAPEHGEHSLRAEVLLAAFARDLLAGTSAGERLVVKGTPPDGDWLQRNLAPSCSKRFVVFSL